MGALRYAVEYKVVPAPRKGPRGKKASKALRRKFANEMIHLMNEMVL